MKEPNSIERNKKIYPESPRAPLSDETSTPQDKTAPKHCPHGNHITQCYNCGYGDAGFVEEQRQKSLEQSARKVEDGPFRYRMASLAEVYLLWRDKELPLGHFPGSLDSTAPGNTVMNFWFEAPIDMDKDFVIRVQKDNLTPIPLEGLKGQTGMMTYDLTIDDDRTIEKRIPEFYNTKILHADELDVARISSVSDRDFNLWAHQRAEVAEYLDDYRDLIKNCPIDIADGYGAGQYDHLYTRDSKTIEQEGHAVIAFFEKYKNFLQKVDPKLSASSSVPHLRRVIKMIHDCLRDVTWSIPMDLAEAEFGEDNAIDDTSAYTKDMVGFFKWVEKLPVIDSSAMNNWRNDYWVDRQFSWPENN